MRMRILIVAGTHGDIISANQMLTDHEKKIVTSREEATALLRLGAFDVAMSAVMVAMRRPDAMMFADQPRKVKLGPHGYPITLLAASLGMRAAVIPEPPEYGKPLIIPSAQGGCAGWINAGVVCTNISHSIRCLACHEGVCMKCEFGSRFCENCGGSSVCGKCKGTGHVDVLLFGKDWARAFEHLMKR